MKESKDKPDMPDYQKRAIESKLELDFDIAILKGQLSVSEQYSRILAAKIKRFDV